MTDPAKSFVDEEHRRLVKILKKRSPQEWAKMVKELNIPLPELPAEDPNSHITMEHVRTAAACLCFWDWFGDRIASERWPHLDKYLNKTFVRVPRELLVTALVALGYPPRWAEARTKDHPYSQKHYNKR